MHALDPGFDTGVHKVPPKFDRSKFVSVELTRRFRSSVENLWAAWSDPKLLRGWWGPEGTSCLEADCEFWVDGKFTLAQKSASGEERWICGYYLELIPTKRIVCTEMFCDREGKPLTPTQAGENEPWPELRRLTIEFERMSAHESGLYLWHEGVPKAEQETCEHNWSSSLEKLARLLEDH